MTAFASHICAMRLGSRRSPRAMTSSDASHGRNMNAGDRYAVVHFFLITMLSLLRIGVAKIPCYSQ
jgi:hypothetical protein